MQVPYEISVAEHWTLGHWRKPSKLPPPPRSAEFDDPVYEEMNVFATAPNPDEDEAEAALAEAAKDTQWAFAPYTHQHRLTLKFYVHFLRDTVDYLLESAGYEPSYGVQPYHWNHVTAVLDVPEPGSLAPCASHRCL